MFYSFLNNPSINPRNIPSTAANIIRYSLGSKNVIVWAGIQNRGIVFKTIKLKNWSHLTSSIASLNVVSLLLTLRLRNVSVIRWKAIIVGANVKFINIEVNNAKAITLPSNGSMLTDCRYSTPLEKIPNISTITIPITPQIVALASM